MGFITCLQNASARVLLIRMSPFTQFHNPLTGTWSQRITREHRLVYEIQNNKILIHSVKGHY